MHFSHVKQDMDVIGNTTYDNVRRVNAAHNRSQVSMNTCSNIVVQERLAVLGTEN